MCNETMGSEQPDTEPRGPHCVTSLACEPGAMQGQVGFDGGLAVQTVETTGTGS